jgi:hypothetical protein
MVKALRYKQVGCGFEIRKGKFFFFSIYLILLAALGLGVHPASNRSVYLKQKSNFSEE